MKIYIFIIFLLIFIPFVSSAHAPKPFLLTHIVYPDLEDYTEFFVNIYTELGFKVELIPTPSLRGLILLNDGAVDADVLRLNVIAEEYPNVIVLYPELKRVSLSLICAKGIPCNSDVLMNKNISVLANSRMLELLDPGEFESIQIDHELFSSVINMLKVGRYFYAIYVVDEVIKKHFEQDFQIIDIKKISISHVIYKKHVNLLPQIQEKIRNKLPKFNRERLKNNNF
jgi:hypothetical protein